MLAKVFRPWAVLGALAAAAAWGAAGPGGGGGGGTSIEDVSPAPESAAAAGPRLGPGGYDLLKAHRDLERRALRGRARGRPGG